MLGFVAIASLTAITFKALDTFGRGEEEGEEPSIEDDKGPQCDDCGAYHDPFPECPLVAAGALSIKEVLCKNLQAPEQGLPRRPGLRRVPRLARRRPPSRDRQAREVLLLQKHQQRQAVPEVRAPMTDQPIVLRARTTTSGTYCARCERGTEVPKLDVRQSTVLQPPPGWWLLFGGTDGPPFYFLLCPTCAAEAAGNEGRFLAANRTKRKR